MRYRLLAILAILVLSSLTLSTALADNLFEAFIKENGSKLSGAVADPFTEIFSTGVTGGIFRSAATHGVLGFDVGFRSMFVRVPSGESAVFDTAGVKFFPVPVIQAAVGLPMQTEIMLRGFGVKYRGASISLLGVGLKKNFKSLIPVPMFPDLAAMISYHRFKGNYSTFTIDQTDLANMGFDVPAGDYNATFDAGNLMKSNHLSFDVIASKKFSLLVFSLQPYLGLGYDYSKMDYEWSLVKTDPEQTTVPLPVTVSGSSKSSAARLTIGLDISPFPFVHIFGDYSISKFKQATAGLAISFR